jgi:competence protein ComEC
MKKSFCFFNFFFVIILFFLNLIAWSVLWDLNDSYLKVIFFDVGQGEAIFIESPQKHQILIDGGPNFSLLEKLGKVMPFWDRDIDLIILTHPEKDHLTGLLEVLKKYNVENVLWTGIVRKTVAYQSWESLLSQEKAKIFFARANQKIIAGEVHLDIFYPFENLRGREFENSNDTSIVTKLVFGRNSFLFTGDISKKVEKSLSEANLDLKANVLKIAHHGSKTSTSEEFVQKVKPDFAVISLGKNNNYGHPHREVLDILKKYDIEILRTDEKGDIKFLSQGERLKIDL